VQTRSRSLVSGMSTPRNGFDLLPPNDVSDVTGASTVTLARWRRQGIGPRFVKLGRKVFYPRDALADWIKAREARSTAEAKQRIRELRVSGV
jgi:predicted DNA-binding transcriptional regulator AlpA